MSPSNPQTPQKKIPKNNVKGLVKQQLPSRFSSSSSSGSEPRTSQKPEEDEPPFKKCFRIGSSAYASPASDGSQPGTPPRESSSKKPVEKVRESPNNSPNTRATHANDALAKLEGRIPPKANKPPKSR
ncbi:hypothetical protein BHYA_0037g00490 [Botrytis hyacinthi]|uniref:Uncharacterized protein n=1 Tax=Botrytis hyacinthi TaxID=278943 RepID=A0A4Z1GVI0_9HELO|nr:hypothetical protein BHYA_0037g00490 [Botrytis hyacinthi]